MRDEPGREVDLPGAMLHQERSGSTEGATCCSGWRRRTRWFVRTGAGAPKVRLEEFESRIRALEGWRAEKAGEERRLSTMSAGAGGVVAVILGVLGGVGYFSIPSRQKNVLPGSRTYFSKTLGKISGYFASLRGIQNIVAGFFGLPPTPITTKTGIRFDRE